MSLRVARAAIVSILMLPVFAAPAAADVGDTKEFPIDTPFGVSGVVSMVTGPDGNLWFVVPDGSGDHVGRLRPDGHYSEFTIRGPTTPGDAHIIEGPDGALWFTQWGQGVAAVGRMTTDGHYRRYPLDSNAQPHDITVGPDGALWCTDFIGNRVTRLDPGTGALTNFPLPTGVAFPDAITSFEGSLRISTRTFNNVLVRMATDGRIESSTTLDLEVTQLTVHDSQLWLGGADGLARLVSSPSGETAQQFATGPAEHFAFDTLGRVWMPSHTNLGLSDGIAPARPPTGVVSRFDESLKGNLQGGVDQFSLPDNTIVPSAIALGPDDQIWVIDGARPTRRLFRMLTGAGGVGEQDFFSRDRLIVLLVATLGGVVIAAVTLDFPRFRRPPVAS